MEYISSKTVDFLIAVCTASAIAFTAGLAAHYVFGASVQTSASIGAAIFALLVATEWFAKLRKSK
jgi:ABC-type transport system involved in cytochrome bd biosynthesis fused ATPase/permease subunit